MIGYNSVIRYHEWIFKHPKQIHKRKGLIKMKNTKYFQGVSTIEELKKAYKTLAKMYHPDKNLGKDTNKIMAEINNEYEYLFTILKDSKTAQQGHSENGKYREVITEIVKYDNVNIDVIGSWIWIYGEYQNMSAIKDSLKSLGFKWSSSNKKWYWTETELQGKRKKATSYEYKVNKYGKEELKTSKNKKQYIEA